MAITNHERVGKALELLRQGLTPFVERDCRRSTASTGSPLSAPLARRGELARRRRAPPGRRPPPADHVGAVERDVPTDFGLRRALAGERAARVSQPLGTPGQLHRDDTYRALDSAARLLTAVSAPQADEVETMKIELLTPALRRAGPRRAAQVLRHRGRERRGGQPQALARSRHAPPGRGLGPLPAGRVRRRFVASAFRPGQRRVPGTG